MIGLVVNVADQPLGAALTADTLTGSTVLPVANVGDFRGGTIELGGVQYAYTDVDFAANTVTLATGLTADAFEDDFVYVWDASSGTTALQRRAYIQLPGDVANDDVIDAAVQHQLIPYLPEGIRAPGAEEQADITDTGGGQWVVTDLPNKVPQFDAGLIAPGTLQQASLGFDLPGGTKVTVSTVAPSSPNVGDVWLDAGNGNQLKQWDGTTWQPYQFGTSAIADGALTAAKAGFTARQIGANTTTTSSTQPTGAIAGDLWVDTSTGNKLWQFNGSTWVSAQDAAIATAQSAAAAASTAAGAAQTTANGRNSIFRQGTTPTAKAVGDVWFDTANGNRVSVWDGSTWQTSQLQGVAVGNLDAGAITTGSLAAARIAAGTITTSMLAANSVTAAQIAANTITAAQIAADTITAAQIAAGAVTAAELAAGAVTAASIAANTITGDKIAAGTITGDLIAANSIIAGQIAAGALDAYQIDAASLSAVTMSGHIVGSTLSGSDFLVDSDAGRLLLYQQAANVVTTDSTPGTSGNTWTVPAGVTSIKGEGWGSGGSGCTSNSNSASGAGGGGEYAAEPSVPVNTGDVVTWTVPAGGAGGFSSTDGGDAILYVNGVEVLRAHGGKKGTTSGGGGKGGTGSTNTIHFDGGKGGTGNGAGGGSSAGTKASGNAGGNGSAYGYSAAPGGVAPTGGGKGGTGGTSSTNGANGNTPGGGGGASGGSSSGSGGSWVSTLAGSGVAGQIQVTYYASTLVASLASVSGATDPKNPANAVPTGLKVQRQDLMGVVGGYARECQFTLSGVASSGAYTYIGNGTNVHLLSDYPTSTYTGGIFTAPAAGFYDTSAFVTGAAQPGISIERSTDSGSTWAPRFANNYASGAAQNASAGGSLWLDKGDQMRWGFRQQSGTGGATLTGYAFIGAHA